MENVNRAQVVDVHELINTLHRQATSNDPEVIPVTLSGSVVSFDDPIGDLSLRECVIDIEPVQSGSGDPSPSNVRPISGWSAVHVYVAPTQSEQDATVYTVSLGQTVYGGTLDVVTGVLTVDRAIVDLGSLPWTSEEATVTGLFRVMQQYVIPLGILYDSIPVCSLLKGVTPRGYSQFAYETIGFSNGATSPLIRARSTAFSGKTGEQLQTYLTGQKIVYELATPITVQLTPTEVTTLLGSNNVWADSGDITVTYLSYE